MLALGTRSGNIAAYAYTGASATRIGDPWDIGAESSGDTSEDVMLSNRIVQFTETNQLIAVGGNQIRAYRDTGTLTGTWEVVHTFVSPASSTDRKIGPFVCYLNNQPTLVVCYLTSNASDNEWIGVTSTDGENWTENTAHTVSFTQYDFTSFYGSHIYRNVIYWWGADGSGTRYPTLFSYDPASDTFASIQPTPGTDWWNTNDIDYASATTYNGKHYCINIGLTSRTWTLLETTGGSFTPIGNLHPDGDILAAGLGFKSALWTDYRGPTEGQAMYALIYTDRGGGDSTDGWVCIEMEDTGTGTFTFL